jgi:hypothetical protein
MVRIDTVRKDAGTLRAIDDTGSPDGQPTDPLVAPPPLASFRAGRSEAERTADLLAFAVAVDRGLPQTPDGIERARQEADAVLGDYSLRYLHNAVERIRQEAIAAHIGRLRQPPGFLALVVANLIALVLAGALGAWLYTRPEFWAALAGLLGN